MPSPQRSLGHSLFKQKFSQKFLCFLVLFCFFVFCVFYFIKISKFALPGVMLIYERTSKDRKKERLEFCCGNQHFLKVFFILFETLRENYGNNLAESWHLSHRSTITPEALVYLQFMAPVRFRPRLEDRIFYIIVLTS